MDAIHASPYPKPLAGCSASASQPLSSCLRDSGGNLVCIALCFGLPASGKSSLVQSLIKLEERDAAKSYKDHLENEVAKEDSITRMKDQLEQIETPKLVYFSYDDIIPVHEQYQVIQMPGSWKECRQSIFEAFEVVLCKHVNKSCDHKCVDAKILQRIESTISLTSAETVPVVFIIEDNFYYQSMRYEWYQLARKYGTGFCQIYLQCSLSTALERNRRREVQVPEEVIQVMHEKLESPEVQTNLWEQHTLTLAEDWNSNSARTDIINLFKVALINPVPPITLENEETKALSRLETSESIFHQMDQILRKIVKTKISQHKQDCSHQVDFKALCKEINTARQNLLSKLKKGELQIPESVASSVIKCHHDDINEARTFLESQLERELGKQ